METFHSYDESANRPKAAPVFCTCVRRKNPGITFRLSLRSILLVTSHLVNWSSNTISMAMRKWYFRIAWGIPMEPCVCIRLGVNLFQGSAASFAYRRILRVRADLV